SIVAMGEGVGPAIGGMIAHYIHWSYLLLIPMITIITVPFLMKLLKKEVRIKGHFDIKGIILMSVGIVFFMLFTTSYSISFLRSEEHTSELQSRFDLVCRLLLEKKKNI